MSRAKFKANRAASHAAWEASLSTPIPPWHPSQHEPGESHPVAPRSPKSSGKFGALMLMAAALSGSLVGTERRR